MIVQAVDHDVARAEAALARLEGRRDAVAARIAELTRDIELAKGRLAVKDEVETFIEAVHGSASRRSLSAFETLLTALVQEVLPGEKPVALDLSTERGLASLDVCVAAPGRNAGRRARGQWRRTDERGRHGAAADCRREGRRRPLSRSRRSGLLDRAGSRLVLLSGAGGRRGAPRRAMPRRLAS